MSKYSVLVQRLHQKTLKGGLSWEETALKNAYQTSFSNYTIRIRLQDHEDNPYIFVSIFNHDGRLIDEFHDESIRDDLQNSYPVMREIYDTARRSALGVEQALDDILDALQEPDE
jgi:hypothetical protein